MGHVVGVERTQTVLFPQSQEEYLSTDNPVRFIDAYVANLDLVKLGFAHAIASETGRPAYVPGDLLRLTYTDTSMGCVPVGGLKRRASAT